LNNLAAAFGLNMLPMNSVMATDDPPVTKDDVKTLDTIAKVADVADTVSNLANGNQGEANGRARNTPDQTALIKMAKADQKTGISAGDAGAYKELGKEAGVPVRGPESHPGRPYGEDMHIHVGPIDHIPIKPE
jgi:hypothetical protein